MSLTIQYELVQHTLSSIGSNVIRYGALALAQSAQIGEAAVSENTWDDFDGSWVVKGYREFFAYETAAPSNNRLVYNGFVLSRTYHRDSSFRTGAARRITVETGDGNTALGWRILFDGTGANSAKRPAETAGDRIRWLVNSSGRLPSLYAHPTIFANPTNAMDANDYRGQRYNDVLADVANTTGYNFFVQYDEGRQRSELLFLDPGGTAYTSTLSLSNSLADINSSTVFAPSEDAELHRDPSRIAGGVYLAWDGGSIYQTRQSIYDEFALVDQTAPLGNVKTETKARAIATRYQNDNDEEDDRITCSFIVPAASVNLVRQGMRMPVRFTHLPGYETSTYARVLKRSVIQEEDLGQDYYRIALELSPSGSAAAATCSTVASAAETWSVDTQSYSLHTVTLPISPSASSFVIGAAVAYNGNTPQDSAVVGTSGWATEHSQSVPAGAPALGVLSKAGVSGSANVTGSYTAGFGSDRSRWAVAALAVPTASTSLVQDAGASDSGVGDADATFASPPTAGNLLVMVVALRGVIAPPDPIALIVAGWTLRVDAVTSNSLDLCDVSIWTKCAEAGEPSTHGFSGESHESVVWLGELALT